MVRIVKTLFVQGKIFFFAPKDWKYILTKAFVWFEKK